MAYSLKIDTNKTDVYRSIEKGVAKYLSQHGFTIISANYLSDSDGNYLTAPAIKRYYAKLPGGSKQVNHDDLALMADCLMSCDFLLDCGNFVTVVDITRSKTSPVSFNKMMRKKNLLKLRLHNALKNGISIKTYCPVRKQYVVKPITKGLIIGLDYIESLDIDTIIDALDHDYRVRFLRFFEGRIIQ